MEKLDLMPVFDWSAWEEGNLILQEAVPDFSKLEIITLCMLFSIIVRKERFCEGYLVTCFTDNTIPKIIKAIQNHVDLQGKKIKTDQQIYCSSGLVKIKPIGFR